MDEERLKRAMEALNALLVMLRQLASEEKCSTKMYRILDDAEVVPTYLLRGEEGWERARSHLEGMAAEYPRECGLALRRFLGKP